MKKCPDEICNVRLLDGRQSPENQKENLISVTSYEVYQEKYYSVYSIKCNKCGLDFEVMEDPGYHTPQYNYPLGI